MTLPSRVGTWIGRHQVISVAILLGICTAAIVGNAIVPADPSVAPAATADLSEDIARKEAAVARQVPAGLPAELTVIKTSHRDSTDGTFRRRWLDAVYRGQLDRASIARTMKESYEFYQAELEAQRPREVMIHIRFTTSEAGSRHGEVLASVDTGLVRKLPDWPAPNVVIQEREEGTRPTEREIRLYETFTALAKQATAAAEAEYRDADGIVKSPRSAWERIDAKEKSELRRLREELFSRGEISEDELDRAFWRCQLWWMGSDASDAAVKRMLHVGQ